MLDEVLIEDRCVCSELCDWVTVEPDVSVTYMLLEIVGYYCLWPREYYPAIVYKCPH